METEMKELWERKREEKAHEMRSTEGRHAAVLLGFAMPDAANWIDSLSNRLIKDTYELQAFQA